MKISFDSKMQLHTSTFKPASRAPCQSGGLGDFGHAKKPAVEAPCRFFFPGRHGKLHVLNADKGTGGHESILTWGRNKSLEQQRLPDSDQSAHGFDQFRRIV